MKAIGMKTNKQHSIMEFPNRIQSQCVLLLESRGSDSKTGEEIRPFFHYGN